MANPPDDPLESFLRQQDASTLVSVLLELAQDHDAVRSRLARLQLADRPDKLASDFRKTLSRWRRSTRFRGLREAAEFGRALETWLEQVDRELLPKDPRAALALFESFLEADQSFFDHADDSEGSVGNAVRAACRHWLRAAARCEVPAKDWSERLVELYSADDYGGRDELLRRADLLLDEAGLRMLVARFEERMESVLVPSAESGALAHQVFRISGALSLLAKALRDPDVDVRGVLRYSAQPNELQREGFARAYLEAGRPADALVWLEEPWQRFDDARLALRAEALGRLGRHDESAPIRQALFERSVSVYDLRRWLEQLPEASRPAALERARAIALDHDDPATAAMLLIEIGDDEAGEAMLLAEPARIRGDDDAVLEPLARALQARERPRGETAVYRALLTAILERGYARAYGQAARCWLRLCEIAASGADLRPLQSHEAFDAAVRAGHARKASFWRRVRAKGGGGE